MNKIKQRWLIFIALLVLGTTYVVFAVHGATPTPTPAPATAPQPSVSATAPPETTAEDANAAAQEGYIRKTAARIADLERMENERHLLAKAAERTGVEREILRVTRRPEWSAYYSTNWPTYQGLRMKAAQACDHKTACSICDGTGRADFCVLCGDHHGKCVRCDGTGRDKFGGYCPACLGTGKCYLCGGTGKMPCDFCEDGVIESHFSPQLMMPLE